MKLISVMNRIPFLSSLIKAYTDIFRDQDDGRAQGRRSILFYTYLTGMVTNLTAGTYFTGLMLAIGADEIFISYITIATTLCGFLQFFSPLLLERMERRKPFLVAMRLAYLFLDIVLLSLIVLLPMEKTLRLTLFLTVIILRNLASAISASGISVWQMQSIPPQKQTGYFTFSNIGSTVIGVVTAFLASSLVDTFEEQTLTVLGDSPTVTAILLLRLAALIIAIPETYFFARVKEYPYTKTEVHRIGLSMLLQPLANRRFMMTVSIYFIWTFANCIIGEFFNVYLISIVHMSYTAISLAAVFSMPMVLLLTPVWSALIGRFGWYRMLPLSFAGYAFAFFCNVLITETTQYFYFVVMALVYIFNPCMNIVFAYLPYINMPDNNRTAYYSIYSLLTTFVTFAATYFGSRFMYFTQGHTLNLLGMKMTNYQYINLVQFAIVMLLGGYVLLVGKKLDAAHNAGSI